MANRQTKRVALTAAAIIAAFFCACDRDPAVGDHPESLADQPHVVFIVLDTLRADKVGCYGGPKGVSAELDAFAETGVRFKRVVAPSNWTKPAWAGMLTGRYPRSLGVYREIGECLPDDAVTLAESFKSAGYRTYGATANPNLNASFNYQQGFDTYRDSHVVWDWMKVAGAGDGDSTANEARLAPATELYEDALEWAKQQDGAPSFIQICTMEMHEYHRGEYSLNRTEFNGEFSEFKSPEREYYQALKQSSYDVARFVADLRALPGWTDTLVVITSDHGEGLSDHPDVARSQFHGGVLYDSNVFVPWIMQRPGALPEGRVVETPVQLIALAPTVLEAAGVPPMHDIDSMSLTPLIKGEETATESLPEFFVMESYLRDLEKVAIESREWRYIENRDQAHEANDQRGQMNPEALQRIGAPQNGKATDQITAHPEIAADLRQRLREWEAAHPKAAPTECGVTLTDEEYEQLQSIGYVGARDQL